MDEVLVVKQLKVSYGDFTLGPVDLALAPGEVLAVVGESGSGKSTLVKAITHLNAPRAQVDGHVLICDREIYALSEGALREMRMRAFGTALQNSRELLNPVLPIKEQVYEILKKKYPRDRLAKEAALLMERSGLSAEVLTMYPRQLSGGMVQKLLIGCATALEPPLLVLDEPTSSLDGVSRQEFVELIRGIQGRSNMAVLLVTHDLGLASQLSQRMLVLYGGKVVEEGGTKGLLSFARHPYTRGLVGSAMDLNPQKDVWGIRPAVDWGSGCPFYGRCTQSIAVCKEKVPPLEPAPDGKGKLACHRGGCVAVLEGRGISKSYGKKQVLENAELVLYHGETASIIGPSGSGKTTLSAILAGYLSHNGGEILFDGKKADFDRLHRTKGGLQMIFQDSESAIDPAMTILDTVCEPLRLSGNLKCEGLGKAALAEVGLPTDDGFVNRKAGRLSGGQKQRLSIARALTMEPRVLVADEPTSMLDVSAKANILRLLKGLQNQRGFSLLMVTHDLAGAKKVSDRVYKMRRCKPVLDEKMDFSIETGSGD